MLKLSKEVIKDLFPATEKNKFQLTTDMKPSGDQIQAIRELSSGLKNKESNQVLLGVTGSGKTFTIANVINNTPATMGEIVFGNEISGIKGYFIETTFFIYLPPCSLKVSPDLSESLIEPAPTLSAVEVTANCVAWPKSKYSLMTKWDQKFLTVSAALFKSFAGQNNISK